MTKSDEEILEELFVASQYAVSVKDLLLDLPVDTYKILWANMVRVFDEE